jgi:hypothetical protein
VNASRSLHSIGMMIASLLVPLALWHPSAAFGAGDQTLVILRTQILLPGDVINFAGGGGAFLGVGEYGHTGMYLGKDPVSGHPVFLDFTTDKSGRSPKEFRGRISSEKDFLNDNVAHGEFTVYRLSETYTPDMTNFQERLLRSAQGIARDKTFGALIDCANAASRALSDAAGMPIIEVRPDGFAEDMRFAAVSLTVSIKDALRELSGEMGEASELKAVKQIGAVPQEARATFAVQESAAEKEWKTDPEFLAYEARYEAFLAEEAQRRKLVEIKEEAAEAERRQRYEHFLEMLRRWEYLKAMTGLACSHPNSFGRLGREGRVPGVSLPDRDLDWKVNKYEAQHMENPCQKYLLTRLVQADGLISGGDMLALVRRYRLEHPSTVDSFVTSVADFFAALGKAVSSVEKVISSDGSDGESASRSSSSSDNGRASRSSGSTDNDSQAKFRQSMDNQNRELSKYDALVHSPDNWSSLNQLRGMSGFK